MSIKPILNNPNAINNKTLNLYSNTINVDKVVASIIEGDEIDLDDIDCNTLVASVSISTPLLSSISGNVDINNNNLNNINEISISSINSSGGIIDVNNNNLINLNTINYKPYPQANLPSSSVFILDPNIGASEYNPLPTDTYASNYYMVDGTGLQSITIKTIGVGLYNGFSIRIGVLAAAICNVVINHNDPSQNQAEQKYPILINNFSNITLNPINPTNFQYVELVYNDNYAGTGDRVWVCSQIKS